MSIGKRLWRLLKFYGRADARQAFSSSFKANESQKSEYKQDTEDLFKKKNLVPKSIEEALGVFDLSPPSSLKQVERRKREILLQYHPDKYNSHPEKEKIATEFTQILNEAYQKLKTHYLKHE